MKKARFVLITAVFLSVTLIFLTSCSDLENIINELANELLSSLETDSPYESDVPDTTSQQVNAIPFSRTPEIASYVLPAEQIGDPVEKEASEIIDEAIAKAISYVNAMKDERHSFESFSFDADANGYIAKLNKTEKQYYDILVAAANRCESIKITESEYPGDLKDFYFAVYEPMTYCEPAISSYFTIDVESYIPFTEDISQLTTHYRSVYDRYFDPDHDPNTDVSSGRVSMEKVRHDAELLDRVVKRIVRFMPQGLSTYDRYYYLAAVLSEQVSYDLRPENCFSAYGALIGGRAVCEGYTTAYYLLCREANLWCAYRDGLPEGQGHTWNMIKLDSGIYNVDVTWCDGYGKPYEKDWYDCFAKSDKVFQDDGHNATAGVEGTGNYEPGPYEK